MTEDYLTGKYGDAKKVGPYRASIFYACDRFDASFEMREWLKEGKIIISNRYVSSSMGHQAGKIKDKKKRKRFLKWLKQLEFDIFKIPKPDKTILLYMPVEVGQKLVDKKGHRDYVGGTKRDIHEADINHLRDAANAYRDVAKKNKWPIINCAPNEKIESLRTIEDIHEELYSMIEKIL
jgi:dTMP kinase